MPRYKLATIAERLGGELRGDGELIVSRVREVEEAGDGEIAVLVDKRYHAALPSLKAAAVVVGPGVEPGRPAVIVADPRRALVELLTLLHPEEPRPAGVDTGAFVSPHARLGVGVYVGPGAVVEDAAEIGDACQIHAHCVVGPGAVLGEGCTLFPRVTLYAGVRLGRRVRIHSGTVVGSDGFGYVRGASGTQVKVPQVGTVEIDDDVEIGANCAIDRATLGVTRIGRGTKIDNLVQIGHNCQIGEECCIVGQAGLAGSVRMGRFCVVAAQAGVADHVTLADGVVVGAQSGVPHDLTPGVWLGTPARPSVEMGKVYAVEGRLPEMRKELRALSARCRRLEEELVLMRSRAGS